MCKCEAYQNSISDTQLGVPVQTVLCPIVRVVPATRSIVRVTLPAARHGRGWPPSVRPRPRSAAAP